MEWGEGGGVAVMKKLVTYFSRDSSLHVFNLVNN